MHFDICEPSKNVLLTFSNSADDICFLDGIYNACWKHKKRQFGKVDKTLFRFSAFDLVSVYDGRVCEINKQLYTKTHLLMSERLHFDAPFVLDVSGENFLVEKEIVQQRTHE